MIASAETSKDGAWLTRNAEAVVPAEEFERLLALDRPLRVKLGLDPTAPKVTLGWSVVLQKLREFQDLGHTAVLIVGDFTAQVGDPSGVSDTRVRLSATEVREHAKGVLEGFRRILLPEPLEVRYNSEWLAGMDMTDVLDLTSHVTVAQMLEREDFRRRFEAERPISVMELLYPLLQGMDSVAVESDVELGGSDQLWNLMAGRSLQGRYGQQQQVAFTMPLLVGLDGVQKMSQSLGNYIAIDDEPEDMFGKVMSIPDEAMPQYYTLASGLPDDEIDDVRAGLAEGHLHPGETKRLLARAIVSRFWGEPAGTDAESAFDHVFREGGSPEDVPDLVIEGDLVYLPRVLHEAGLVKSRSEARRLISQGAVKVDGKKIADEEVARATVIDRVVQVGKRRFIRLIGD